MNIQTIQTIIYVVVGELFFLVAVGLILKQYWAGKFKKGKKGGNKVLVSVVDSMQEETPYILEVDGLTTEGNKKGRAYVVKSAQVDKDGKTFSGSTHDHWYPEGWPRFMQTKVRKMDCSEGNPNAVNYYGSQEDLNITDSQINVIHQDAYDKAVLAVTNDTKELLDEIRKSTKPINKTVLYVLIAIAIVAALASAYIGFQNMGALQDIKSGWGL